jgi:hypothetical protein
MILASHRGDMPAIEMLTMTASEYELYQLALAKGLHRLADRLRRFELTRDEVIATLAQLKAK